MVYQNDFLLCGGVVPCCDFSFEDNDVTPTGDFWADINSLTKLNNRVRTLSRLGHYDLSDLSDLRSWEELNKSLSVQQNGRVRLVTTLYIRPKCPSVLSIF